MKVEMNLVVVDGDRQVTVDQIEKLMDRYDKRGVFRTRHNYGVGFRAHFNRLIAAGQVMTAKMWANRKMVHGFLSWILIDEQRKKDVNKVMWVLPEDCSQGDILYITACLTAERGGVYKFRERLTAKLKDKVKEVIWFNTERGKFVRIKVKGGEL